ncbi:hypothetical protein [Microbacterium sp. APC 3901]|uniref:hypothetical protein n=1 Tax=Microbacterium sp. APC 3901 TaxID=3035192 RepID=UPI0025B5FF55|nr:hypothetical protein [Microbacterium sp. APC 3901]MDN3443128.1 hypothetical protein [Microbacterium sp. APC 3901]
MSDGYTVDTGVLRADAELWRGWGDTLAAGADSISDTFEYWAFSDQPGFEALRDEYLAAAADLRQKIRDGGTLFRAMGSRLEQVAEIYEKTEDEVGRDIRGA